MAFQCIVVTPEQQAVDETVTQAILPAHDGQIGILTGRAPLLVKLGLGPLRLDLANGQRRLLYIEGGVAQMKDNRLTVLTQEALRPEEITSDQARTELAEASALRITDEKSFNERQRRIERARSLEQLTSR